VQWLSDSSKVDIWAGTLPDVQEILAFDAARASVVLDGEVLVGRLCAVVAHQDTRNDRCHGLGCLALL